jgi:hypothetical protein
VPHAYELHVEVTAMCLCCRAPRTFVFASPTDQVVCASCVAHLGSDKSERRDLQHVAMWADLYADQRINHEAEVEGLSATIAADAETVAALRDQVAGWTAVAAGKFADSRSSGVRELVETEVLARSARSVELLQRRIDRLMAALWKIEALHHDKPGVSGSSWPVGKRVRSSPSGRHCATGRARTRPWLATADGTRCLPSIRNPHKNRRDADGAAIVEVDEPEGTPWRK